MLYAFVLFTGLLSNALLVVALLKERAFSNITNLFVLTLAFSDIGQCLFNMPVQLHNDLKETYNFSQAMCQVVHTLFALPLHLSCLTILLIAVDRYRIIVYPLSPRFSPRCAGLLILTTIIVSVINSIPVALFTSSDDVGNLPHISEDGNMGQYCKEDWSSPQVGKFIMNRKIMIVVTQKLEQFTCMAQHVITKSFI